MVRFLGPQIQNILLQACDSFLDRPNPKRLDSCVMAQPVRDRSDREAEAEQNRIRQFRWRRTWDNTHTRTKWTLLKTAQIWGWFLFNRKPISYIDEVDEKRLESLVLISLQKVS